MNKKNAIFVIGLPGSGKSTLSSRLTDENTDIISSGILISKLSNPNQKYYIDNYVNLGIDIPDNIYCNWIISFINQSNKRKFIIEGFPSNYKQVIIAKKMFESSNVSLEKVLYLNISKENAMIRLLNRRVCQICNISFSNSILKCTNCGRKTTIRQDDNFKIATNRLINYSKSLNEVKKYYYDKNLLIEINANESSEKKNKKLIKQIKRL